MVSSSKPTILLTGGAGFVGQVLCRQLCRSFPASRRVVLTRNILFSEQGWETSIADITDFGAVRSLVADIKPDVVLHLAAQASVANAQGQAEQTWRTNFIGTMSIGSAVAQSVPAALVFFSSSGEVYGSNLRSGPANEEVDPQPLNPYSSSKLAAERVLRDILSPQNKLIIARSFNHSGPGQDRRFVLPSFAAQVVEAEFGLRKPELHVGNLEAKRDFLHVNDVVEAYLGLLNAAHTLPSLTVVNVCSGRALPISFYLAEMQKMAKVPLEVIVDQERMRPSEIPSACGDNSLLRSLIAWSPRTSPSTIVHELLTCWRKTYARDCKSTVE